LSSRRPYKPPYPREKCFQMIREENGTHFDPDVVEAFFSMRSEIVRTQLELTDVDVDVQD
jgi:putative two-component system response regulator